MNRNWLFTTAIATALLTTSALAQDGVITENITFKEPDPEATSVARAMYGKEFRLVQAKRVWLEEPNDGYDQMVVRLGKDSRCQQECYVAALYHNDEWLEVWRSPGREIGLGPIAWTGMKTIFDNKRAWQWFDRHFLPRPQPMELQERSPTEEESAATIEALNTKFGPAPEGIDPPRLSAYDIDLKTGKEVAVTVQSIYYCGNAACPLILLDEDKKPISVLSALDTVFSVIKDRDEEGWHLVEVLMAGGVSTYSVGKGEMVNHIGPMEVTVAGDPR